MKALDLVVPGLCGPLPDIELVKVDSTLQSLGKLLGRADREQVEHSGLNAELATIFSLQEAGSFPSAALYLYGEGKKPVEGYWFHADPVHLQADLDRAILRESSSLNLNVEESMALVEEVNAHFAADGLRLEVHDAHHWFIRTEDAASIKTTDLYDAIGCNVNFHLPGGRDQSQWKQFLNEVQMLFHQSEVNQQRELRGELAVNSLWLWGGGTLPTVDAIPGLHICSDMAVVKGLAELGGATHHSLASVDEMMDAVDEYQPLMLVIDDIYMKACYGDLAEWQRATELVYEKYLRLLVEHAMKSNICLRLYPCNGCRYMIKPSSKYRFYRKTNIMDHLSRYE